MAAATGFMFGPWPCRWSEVFYLSKQSIALVNLKPIVPGHCLVISKRVVTRFTDLSSDEVSDMWNAAQTIGKQLEGHYHVDSLTFAIQDGKSAGQSVPHVHIHVLPRKPGDFPKNDQIYDELDKTNLDDNFKPPSAGVDAHDREARTKEEMAKEALSLRPLFHDTSLPIPIDDE